MRRRLAGGAMGAVAALMVAAPVTATGPLNPHDMAGMDEADCQTCHVPRDAAPGASDRGAVSAGGSLLCLGCHDDVIAQSQRIHDPGHWTRGPWLGFGEPSPRFGMDTHAGMPYPQDKPGFATPEGIRAAGLRLYEGRVQCATCHQPHGDAGGVPLRIPNQGSALCLTCHLK